MVQSDLADIDIIELGESFEVFATGKLSTFMDHISRFRPTTMGKEPAEVIDALQAAIRVRDAATARHQSRTGYLSGAIAKVMGFDRGDVFETALAGYVHDVGKLTTPLHILQKDTSLEDHEFERIREHPEEGHRMISGLTLTEEVKHAVLYHHERLDGSGYPHGLPGTNLPMVTRIVAVADIVDAVVNDRPYRRALRTHETVEILQRDAGTRLDAEVVDATCDVLERISGQKTRPRVMRVQEAFAAE
ncbi:MAG: HD domain-containing protein [Alphaproteobacteria bacterium]|nr:HD domain-containing protein [Alphaproteobacteria bacterium]